MVKKGCCRLSEPVVNASGTEHAGSAASTWKPDAATEKEIDALLRDAFARDLNLLAVLNDREPTAEFISNLRTGAASDWFAFKAPTPLFESACALLDTAFDAIPDPVDQGTLDELSADFAAIYLIHSYRAPPTESPWLDKDQLERQEPMFELAEWYARFGLAAQDRQRRYDDHLVLQLQFLSHLFASDKIDVATSTAEAARFLDRHLLRWIGDFAKRVAQRCETPYFCGVVTQTHTYLESLRDVLEERFGQERPQIVADASPPAGGLPKDEDDELAAYVPGLTPSW